MTIGRAVKVFYDESRIDPFSKENNRSLVVSVYYPLDIAPAADAAYMDLFDPAREQALDMLVEMGADRQHLVQLRTNIRNTEDGVDNRTPLPSVSLRICIHTTLSNWSNAALSF